MRRVSMVFATISSLAVHSILWRSVFYVRTQSHGWRIYRTGAWHTQSITRAQTNVNAELRGRVVPLPVFSPG
jgi:hypothetical protein